MSLLEKLTGKAKELFDIIKTKYPDAAPDIESILNSIEPAAPANTGTAGTSNEIEELKNLTKTLAAENQKLFSELSERNKKDKEREELLKTKAQEENKIKIEEILKKAIDEKKIPAKNEELYNTYKAALENNLENGKKIIDSLQAINSAGEKTTQTTQTAPPVPGVAKIDQLRNAAIEELKSKQDL